MRYSDTDWPKVGWKIQPGKKLCQKDNFPLAAISAYGYSAQQGSGRSSGVEHNLAKVRVGRSNRLARSKIN